MIESILEKANVEYELIKQDKPILSAMDAEGYYPVEKSAPTFVLDTDKGLVGCITSLQNGRLDFNSMKTEFGFEKLKMADRKKIKKETGYEVGSIPLVGLGLPCLFDKKLLNHDQVYGGTGDEYLTLKIAPQDLMKVNDIIGVFE
ncbi:Cys-tRNA(Pro) deacylase, prolyl-tRNA editing enzyme YbaK/EbsC [Lachnospiraceae bacterium]|nr:Cys-tRNA(Pro) deacylase, prolyl-tRNA editing enzyme YbaK/EbsC [Lachnospiraceae bacterium]